MATVSVKEPNSVIGIILTLVIIGFGLYIGFKNFRRDGFWWGVLALFLISSSIYISSGPSSIATTTIQQ